MGGGIIPSYPPLRGGRGVSFRLDADKVTTFAKNFPPSPAPGILEFQECAIMAPTHAPTHPWMDGGGFPG